MTEPTPTSPKPPVKRKASKPKAPAQVEPKVEAPKAEEVEVEIPIPKAPKTEAKDCCEKDTECCPPKPKLSGHTQVRPRKPVNKGKAVASNRSRSR